VRLLVSAAAVAATAGCGLGSGGGTRLIWPGPNTSAGIGQPNVTAGRDFSVGSMMICATGTKERVRVIDVVPFDPSGQIVVKQFATRPNPFLSHPEGGSLTGASGPLTRHGFTVTGAQFVQPCGPKGPASEGYALARTELGVSLARSGSTTGSDKGLTVTYVDAGGHRRTLVVRLELTLCSPHATQAAKCGI
jgi:hypothetical protein